MKEGVGLFFASSSGLGENGYGAGTILLALSGAGHGTVELLS
jgi:hypothetical protein